MGILEVLSSCRGGGHTCTLCSRVEGFVTFFYNFWRARSLLYSLRGEKKDYLNFLEFIFGLQFMLESSSKNKEVYLYVHKKKINYEVQQN